MPGLAAAQLHTYYHPDFSDPKTLPPLQLSEKVTQNLFEIFAFSPLLHRIRILGKPRRRSSATTDEIEER